MTCQAHPTVSEVVCERSRKSHSLPFPKVGRIRAVAPKYPVALRYEAGLDVWCGGIGSSGLDSILPIPAGTAGRRVRMWRGLPGYSNRRELCHRTQHLQPVGFWCPAQRARAFLKQLQRVDCCAGRARDQRKAGAMEVLGKRSGQWHREGALHSQELALDCGRNSSRVWVRRP